MVFFVSCGKFKCDRLLLELHLDPLLAYERLRRIVEDVNALCGTLHAEHVMVCSALKHMHSSRL